MVSKKGWSEFGRAMSENYELFDGLIDSISELCTSERKLIKFIKHSEISTRDSIFKATYKDPLGSEFLRRIYDEGDSLSLIVNAHLFVENFLDDIIRKKFRYSKVLFEKHEFTFSVKLAVLKSKNYLDEKLYSDIQLVNSLRNKFAHNLFYDVADFDISKFYYCDELYRNVKVKNKEAKRAVNVYMLRLVFWHLLARLTNKYPFIADIKIKK